MGKAEVGGRTAAGWMPFTTSRVSGTLTDDVRGVGVWTRTLAPCCSIW
jgi:hypothetical protein